MIEIRKIIPSDAAEIKRIMQAAFNLFERIFISAPKDGLVAVLDGKIVGGTIVRCINTGGHKIGYVDGAFIHPDYHANGIGTQLYKATEEYLWQQGCTAQTAFVKDDNVASWKLFLNNGFSQVSFFAGAKTFGLKAMLQFYFATAYFAASGMECYLKMKDTPVQSKAKNSPKNILLYLLANSLCLLFGCVGLQAFVGNDKNYFLYIAAFASLLATGVAAAFLGTLFTGRKWHFRLNSGGAVFTAMFGFLGGVYPMIANWYPDQYEKGKQFQKDMAMPALFEWLALLAFTAVSCFFAANNLYCNYVFSLGVLLLVYKLLYIYPFGAMGGARIFQWSKWAFWAMAVLTVGVICLVIAIQ